MSTRQKKIHKLGNLIRFGYRQGWIVPVNGAMIVAESTPQYFHDRLARFQNLFHAEMEKPLPLP